MSKPMKIRQTPKRFKRPPRAPTPRTVRRGGIGPPTQKVTFSTLLHQKVGDALVKQADKIVVTKHSPLFTIVGKTVTIFAVMTLPVFFALLTAIWTLFIQYSLFLIRNADVIKSALLGLGLP